MLRNGVDTFRCHWRKWLWNCVFPSLEATRKVSIKHWILDHRLSYLTLCSRFVEYFLPTEHYSKPFPIQQFPSPASLCAAVLRNFSRKNLLSSNLRTSTISRPPEAQFQDEWYRAFYSVVGHGVAISSEWSSDGDGRIDFRVKDPEWGFELLRDGDRLSQHCSRFLPQGSYHRWITQGFLTDWIILDCRHTLPQRYSETSQYGNSGVTNQRELTICARCPRNQAVASVIQRQLFFSSYSWLRQ